MEDEGVRLANRAAVRRATEREAESESKYECPACHETVSAEDGSMCVGCAVNALSKFGWGPL